MAQTYLTRVTDLIATNVALPMVQANPFPTLNLIADYNPIIRKRSAGAEVGATVFDGKVYGVGNSVPALGDNNIGETLVSSGSSAPSYNPTGLNGRPTVLHDGVAQFLTAQFPLAQPFTHVMLARQVTWTANDKIFDGFGSNNSGALNQAGTSPGLRQAAGGGTTSTPNSGWAVGAWAVVIVVFDGASSLIQVDGTVQTGTVGTSAPAANGLTIARGGASGAFANVEWARHLTYGANLDATTRAMIVQAMRSLYGLS